MRKGHSELPEIATNVSYLCVTIFNYKQEKYIGLLSILLTVLSLFLLSTLNSLFQILIKLTKDVSLKPLLRQHCLNNLIALRRHVQLHLRNRYENLDVHCA